MNVEPGDIVALLGGLAGIIMAAVALYKVRNESFAIHGAEWRELLTLTKQQLDRLEKEMAQLESEVVQLERELV
jgi:hypothetical protein